MTLLKKKEVARLRVEEVPDLRKIMVKMRVKMELEAGILMVTDIGPEIHRLITMSRKKTFCDATE